MYSRFLIGDDIEYYQGNSNDDSHYYDDITDVDQSRGHEYVLWNAPILRGFGTITTYMYVCGKQWTELIHTNKTKSNYSTVGPI